MNVRDAAFEMISAQFPIEKPYEIQITNPRSRSAR